MIGRALRDADARRINLAHDTIAHLHGEGAGVEVESQIAIKRYRGERSAFCNAPDSRQLAANFPPAIERGISIKPLPAQRAPIEGRGLRGRDRGVGIADAHREAMPPGRHCRPDAAPRNRGRFTQLGLLAPEFDPAHRA